MRTLAPLAMASYMASSQPPHAQPDDTSSSSRKRRRAAATATTPPPPPSAAPSKRHRTSLSAVPSPGASISHLIDRRRSYLNQLSECTPFRIAYREVTKGQREGTSPSQLVKVWLVGLNVDRAAYTVRKRDGLRVVLHYRNTAHLLLTRLDATSSSTLATFLYHVATHEITRQQLDSWFTAAATATTQPTLAALVSRFETMSGLEKLIYTNCYNQHALLTDLLSRGMRVKLRDDIPDLSRRNKMLRPMRDGKVKVEADSTDERTQAAEERKDGSTSRPRKEEKAVDKRAVKRDRAVQQPQLPAAVSSSVEQKDGKEESSDTEDEQDDESDTVPADGSLDSLPASADMSTPPITPFSRYSYVVVWWSSQPQQPSMSPQPSSHSRLQALMGGLMLANSQVGVWEMSGEEVDVETVLTRLHVRILAALSAPVITASTPQQRVADILSHIGSQSAALPAPLPLRVEDACLVMVDRSYFERTVWPLIATPASVYELTEESPVMEYVDGRQTSAVKAERGTVESAAEQSTALTPAQQKEEERTAALSRKLVNEHIRRICAPSPFLIYHLTSALPSLFFPPTPSKPLWSVAAGVELTRPLVVEWPIHLPFDAAVIMLWCQWQLTVKQTNNRGGEVLVIVPCRCWRRRGVRDMRTELAEADMRGRLYGRDRGGREDRDGNVVELRGVVVSMRPSPLPMERRMLVSDDAHFFVLQLAIRPPPAAVNSVMSPPSIAVLAPAALAVPPSLPAAPSAPSDPAAAAPAPTHHVVSAPSASTSTTSSSKEAQAPASIIAPCPPSASEDALPKSATEALRHWRPSPPTPKSSGHQPASRSISLLSSPPPLQADPLSLQPAHRTRSKTTTTTATTNGSPGDDGGWISVNCVGASSTAPTTVSIQGYQQGGSGDTNGGRVGQRWNAASRMRGRSGGMVGSVNGSFIAALTSAQSRNSRQRVATGHDRSG